MSEQKDGQVIQVHGDAPTMEGNGTGVAIGGDGVQPVWKGGGHAGGGGGAFQIPGATPGPKIQQLASNLPEHQEGAESLGQLVNMMRRWGADTQVSENFYRVVVQAVLLFGLELWVMYEAAERPVEGMHKGLL